MGTIWDRSRPTITINHNPYENVHVRQSLELVGLYIVLFASRFQTDMYRIRSDHLALLKVGIHYREMLTQKEVY